MQPPVQLGENLTTPTNEVEYSVPTNGTSPNETENTDVFKDPFSANERVTLPLISIVIFIGVIGNFLVCAIMLRAQFRKMSLGIYLFALALADNATLLTNRLTRDLVHLIFGVNLRTHSDLSCRIFVYLSYSTASISSWIVVAVSVERLLVVCFPFRARELSTRRRAAAVLAGIVVILLAAHSFLFWMVRLRKHGDSMECKFITKEENNGILPALVVEFFHLCTYCVLPAVLLLAANTTIIVKLAQSRRFQEYFMDGLRRPSGGSTSGNNVASAMGGGCGSGCGGTASSSSPSTSSSSSWANSVRRTTGMLIIMSSFFVLLTLPLSLFLLQANLRQLATERQVEVVLFWFKVVNHAANFLLYSVSGPAFRRELRAFCRGLCCCRTAACADGGGNDGFGASGIGNGNSTKCMKISPIKERIPLTHV